LVNGSFNHFVNGPINHFPNHTVNCFNIPFNQMAVH
jgi:hypothetical protein